MTNLNSPASESGSELPIASDHNAPMRVEMVPTCSLKIDSESVRTFSREDLKSARSILKRFDIRIPVVADADDRVLIGEILLIAARELQIEYLPVVRLDHLDRLECQAISVAYARMGELGSFDQARMSHDAISTLTFESAFHPNLPSSFDPKRTLLSSV